MIEQLNVKTSRKVEFVDITAQVEKIVKNSGVKDGVCRIFAPHTTAGITINENADPDVARDIINHLDKMVPENGNYQHAEGNSPGHIKSTLTGVSQTVFVENGSLKLGTWQAIYFCEFDGPRSRRVWVKIS